MNKFLLYSVIYMLIFLCSGLNAQEIEERLATLAGKYDFKFREIESDTFFSKKFLLLIDQPLDYKQSNGAEFTQRVYLSHVSTDRPVVFITEGYAANYAANPRYIHELSGILKANQICVEHRYFGESIPDDLEWEYLTIENSASDHHRIHEILSAIYTGDWVSTGISKGGQTTMFYRYFFPNDVAASVAYVAPLNFSIEDKRIYRFLSDVGDSTTRKSIFDYQTEMLKNKKRYLPSFEKLAKKKKLNFDMGLLQAYELTLLEYPFAYWQWGVTHPDSIPSAPSASPNKMVEHLDEVAGAEWVSNEGIERMFPFFYQALTEIGFYGYDIAPFRDNISFTKNPVFDFTLPEGMIVSYRPSQMQAIDQFIRHKAENMIFIYGENDPWSATAVEITYNSNLLKIVKPGGSHLTRINNLPEQQKARVVETLKKWVED